MNDEAVKQQVHSLLQKIREEPTHRNYWFVHKKLQNIDIDSPDKDKIQISLLSSHTIDLLKIYLDLDSRLIDLNPSIWVAPFNQFQQTILNDQGKLYQLNNDVIICDLHLESLTSGDFLADFPRLDHTQIHEEFEEILRNLTQSLEILADRTDAIILFSNFIVPTSSPFGILDSKQDLGYQEFYRKINMALADHYRGDSQVYIFDLDTVAAEFGKSRITNNKLYYRGTIKYSEEFLPKLSHAYMGYIKALKNRNRKAIILDLDNTLWGGIIGEDGIDGVKLNQNYPGKEFYEFQQGIKQLYNRGIILAINSKNNFDDAIEAIREHPAMVLREDHFAAMRINWQDKVQNIIEIAEELNIGIDSLVFMDDNPVERARVESSLPEVLVVDMPDNPHDYLSTLQGLNDFNTLSLTKEDLKRGEMYVARRKRKSLESDVQSMENFIKSLEIKAQIKLADEFALPRVTSLVNRTNQFNVATRRYTENQIQEFYENDPSMRIYTLQVTDKFGDEGIVGVAMVQQEKEHWEINNFMMSCRVIGRKIETAFIQKILNDAIDNKIDYVEAVYIPTKKNNLVVSLWDEHGFEMIQKDENGSKEYQIKLDDKYEYPKFIDVISE